MKSHVFRLAPGDKGIEQTLRHMERVVKLAQRHREVIVWAQNTVRFVAERDKDAEARAIFGWIRKYVRYTNDPYDVEVVKEPRLMLREFEKHGRVVGDCDDQSVLLASGLRAVGIPTEFIVVGRGESFSHVLIRYLSPKQGWVTMDPIVRGTGPGWFPEDAARTGHMSGGRLREYTHGLSGLG